MRKRFLIAVFVLVLLAGCFAAVKPEGVTDSEWNLMQFQSVYNAQFKDAMAMAKNPAITPAQEDIVRKKVAVLQQVKPLIDIYAAATNSGRPVDPKQEQTIYDLLTSLGGKIERAVSK